MSISVSVSDAGNGNVAVSYTSDAEAGLHRGGGYCNISWPGGGTSLYGSAGSTTVFVGYYTTASAQAGISYFKNTDNSHDHDEASFSSATTGGPPYTPPPSAPSAPALTGTYNATSGQVSLSWTNVGSTGYAVFRDGVMVTSTGSTSYSETPGAGSHSYYIEGYNSNAGGTTYSAASNTYSMSPAGILVRSASGTWVRKPLPKPRYIRTASGTWAST